MLFKHYVTYSWLLLLLLTYGAHGAETQAPELGPYEARIAVDSQSDAVRRGAMSKGLQQVIVNLLGHQQALYEPEIRRALNVPEQYVMQFSYETGLPDQSTMAGPIITGREDKQKQTFLKMKFLQRRVDDLLRAADQIEAGELQTIDIEIQGVIGFNDYAGTLTALQALPMVRNVSPVLVQSDQVEFRLDFEGDINLLTAAMDENTRLHALDAGMDPVFVDSLSYELR